MPPRDDDHGSDASADAVFVVGRGAEGRRLDHLLSEHLSLSRAAVKRLLDAGLVSVNGHGAAERDKGQLLEAGDRVEVLDPGSMERVAAQPEAALRIVAAGEGWLVVDKQAGSPVHPLRPGETGTVLNAVVARYPLVQGVGEGGLRSGVVHRLDVDTSGALLFAAAQPTWLRLRAAFNEHRIRKTYFAIVAGRLTGEAEEVAHLAVTRHRPARVSVVDASHPEARRCNLAWRTLAATDAASLIEVELGTGFLHQVRVMMAHRGHPLLGDAWYGSSAESPAAAPAARPMLHARALAYEEIEANCDPPADFMEVMEGLGLGTR